MEQVPDVHADVDRRDPMPQLITRTQMAAVLGTTERYINSLDKSGWIPGRVEVGSLPRWDINVIRAWIKVGCPKQWPPV